MLSAGRANGVVSEAERCEQDVSPGKSGFGAALWTLARLGVPSATRVFGGVALRTLDGALLERFGQHAEQSRGAARKGKVLVMAGPVARASSVLPAQGANRYEAVLLLDDSSATAWCEGVSGSGVGEWIEVRMPVPGVVRQVGIQVGYNKSRDTFQRNGRPIGLSVGGCGGVPGANGFSVDGESFGIQMLDVSTLAVAGCVRITIRDTTPSGNVDTCISEIWLDIDE
jgi:hypothetical protein